jgi:hypothetical protein
MRATLPAHIIILEFISLILYGDFYKLWSSLLLFSCYFSLSGLNIILNTLFWISVTGFQ